MGAARLFGVSLALGAFVAGAIISQSPLRHQVGADVFAFREAFSVVALIRGGQLIANPKSLTVFTACDRTGMIGEKVQPRRRVAWWAAW